MQTRAGQQCFLVSPEQKGYESLDPAYALHSIMPHFNRPRNSGPERGKGKKRGHAAPKDAQMLDAAEKRQQETKDPLTVLEDIMVALETLGAKKRRMDSAENKRRNELWSLRQAEKQYEELQRRLEELREAYRRRVSQRDSCEEHFRETMKSIRNAVDLLLKDFDALSTAFGVTFFARLDYLVDHLETDKPTPELSAAVKHIWNLLSEVLVLYGRGPDGMKVSEDERNRTMQEPTPESLKKKRGREHQRLEQLKRAQEAEKQELLREQARGESEGEGKQAVAPATPVKAATAQGATSTVASERSESKEEKEKQNIRIDTRWMIRRDMPEVQHIEERSFDCAWTEEDFLRCLRQRNCIGLVAEQSGANPKVLGFTIYELHRSRLHVLNFAVHPDFRRRGVGKQMVEKLISKLSSRRRTRITLEIPESNVPAQLFFRNQEFRATEVFRGYYDDSGEDAFHMQYYHPEAFDDGTYRQGGNRIKEHLESAPEPEQNDHPAPTDQPRHPRNDDDDEEPEYAEA